jgi:hypothetical protein
MRGSERDLPITVDVEELTIREADWGTMRVSLITCHKNLDISSVLKGLPDDMCQCPHWGYILKGRKLVKYKDHEEVLLGGDSYYMPPGHTTITDPETTWVEFSPIDELTRTNEVVERNLANMRQSQN